MNSKNKRELMEQRYKLHQASKPERLEELNQKISRQEVPTAFKYGAICNSVFGKKRILSRERINERILAIQNQNRL